ncbi:MAG: sulfate:proton symporter [Candidatus Entotheonella factor]|uniref:Sulfate:proton symporter n=1 Tax=Entotheonella factor TaxID=1429438 RepID=W4LTJ2_ENTF1|nr:MAG: sulfate:proton symporter [Candidatus Entotheonella factor]
MASDNVSSNSAKAIRSSSVWRRYLPFLTWLPSYQRQDAVGDLLAGVIVAIMLIPQSMAYAMLAGLPPQAGLYASIVPLALYGLFGTSRTLAVGPVAMVSLLAATGLSQLAAPGEPAYIALALVLALLVGVMQFAMGVVRLGFLVNFLSHPVLSGFTSAAALVIAASQLKHLLGLKLSDTPSFFALMDQVIRQSPASNGIALALGLASIALLIYVRGPLDRQLSRRGVPGTLRTPMTKAGPLVVVGLSILLVWGFQLDHSAGIKIVGDIPTGLPPLTLPVIEWPSVSALLPTALTISLVGFMESISVAKSLASRRRQKVDANQELIALGLANLGAAATGGYPVTGGFSRSMVNFTTGANTGLASIITAGLVALTVLFLTPWLYYLPQATLAAIIIVAVASLIDVGALQRAWRYDKTDAASLVLTFGAVLAFGIETGIGVGVASALAFYLWRTTRPHMAIVGRVGESEHFRNVLRHEVTTIPHVLAIRMDESLYFANAYALEDVLTEAVADHPGVRHVVLICSAVNAIDSSALETLVHLIEDLRAAHVEFYLAEVKGPVMDRLQQAGFVDRLGKERIFLSTHQALQALGASSDAASTVNR